MSRMRKESPLAALRSKFDFLCLDGLVYVEAIDRAREQFGWTQVQTARAAVSRGGNSVANWIRGERASGIVFTAWQEDNMVNMRPAFLTRFGPKYTTGGAVAAIADLKQRSGETVGDFLDRVKIAVDMLHYNVEEADRNQACLLYTSPSPRD